MPSLESSAPATPLGGDDALRDWFAGQALVGMIPTPRAPGVLPLSIDGMAEAAYQYAENRGRSTIFRHREDSSIRPASRWRV
jgi:hypothetical protein